MALGDKIKQIRNDKGLTQVQLAELIGLSDRTIQYYEGNSRVPSLEVLKIIAEKLNVSLLVLLENEIATIDIIHELQRRENIYG